MRRWLFRTYQVLVMTLIVGGILGLMAWSAYSTWGDNECEGPREECEEKEDRQF